MFVSQGVVSLPSAEIFSLWPALGPAPASVQTPNFRSRSRSLLFPAKSKIFCNSNVPHLGQAAAGTTPHLLLTYINIWWLTVNLICIIHWGCGPSPCVLWWRQDNFIFMILTSYHLLGRLFCSSINQEILGQIKPLVAILVHTEQSCRPAQPTT